MNATSRASAPKASAIATIAEAAPGAEPQIAVLPGRTPKRVSSRPSPAATAITEPMPST
jgi:hypothetical protein